MSERTDLAQQIERLQAIKEMCAEHAMLIQQTNPQIADGLDAVWNAASDALGRLHSQLREIEAPESRREILRDRSYGRSL